MPLTEMERQELEAHRSYDRWVSHFERYLRERGAPDNSAHDIARFMIWWAGVLAKTNKWLTWIVAAAFIAAVLGFILTRPLNGVWPGSTGP